MNTLLNGLKNTSNYGRTENGAVKHNTTNSDLLDMFAMGGAYRNRSDEDCILLFKKAYEENSTYALKCLFYLRDILEGQGERRFFRVCMKWFAQNHAKEAKRNMRHIPEFGRWDDLYCLVGTPIENDMFAFIKEQLILDIKSKTPSLLGKWLKSCNASSKETRELGILTTQKLGLTQRKYRKILSELRQRINIVERLMSENRWDEIEFDKLPSRAGLIYRNAFARNDIIKEKYKKFAESKNTKVNAKALTPVDVAHEVFNNYRITATDRQMLDKYWENLKDYYNGREENAIAICDVSGSMAGRPLEAAISMSAYIAERGKGPFKDHFITFSANPTLVKFEGANIYDKFYRCKNADWGQNTNVEAALDLILKTALKTNCSQAEMPQTLYIFSDMEFDDGMISGPAASYPRYRVYDYVRQGHIRNEEEANTLFEKIADKWAEHGYELPRVIFWNLDARHENIPAMGNRFSYVSGFSMNMVEAILSGKNGYDLMMEKLNTPRYEVIGG